MKVAIYSRKSRYTGQGESVENQINMCKEHGMNYLDCKEEDFLIYEDEGFSGGNTDRPRFQQMLRDARNKRFETIICYRLDRVSRNVSDFSHLIDRLEKLGVSFVSVKEQFDTTKPMGRAMMYIASVFSQLERETIAERIRDNMLQLAKTGRWLGGTTPTGFVSEMVAGREADGRVSRSYRLVVVPEEAGIVHLIFRKYQEFKSITKVEKYLAQNRICTRNGAVFGRFSIRFILSNPVYAIADKTLYEYLNANNYEIYSHKEEFNGASGLMGYNKTRQNGKAAERYRKSSEWILAVGQHEGIVPSQEWIEAQELLLKNRSKSYRKVKSSTALLSGVLRCADCGSLMRPKAGKRLTSNGQRVFYYICELKEKSCKAQCQMANANGNMVDGLAIRELEHILEKYPPIIDEKCLAEMKSWFGGDNEKDELHMMEEKLFNTDFEIKNLIRVLAKEENPDLEKSILEQLENLNMQKQTYIDSIESLLIKKLESQASAKAPEMYVGSLFPPQHIIWEQIGVDAKRSLLKILISRLEWDGSGLKLVLNTKG